jgi:hypothetical protein
MIKIIACAKLLWFMIDDCFLLLTLLIVSAFSGWCLFIGWHLFIDSWMMNDEWQLMMLALVDLLCSIIMIDPWMMNDEWSMIGIIVCAGIIMIDDRW